MQHFPHRDCTGDSPSPSTSDGLHVNWVQSDRAAGFQLRSEQDIIEGIRHDPKVAAATTLCREALRDHGRDEIAPPEMQRVRPDGKREKLSYYQIARTNNLTAAAFSTGAPAGTPRKGLSGHATGLFVYDLDMDVTDLAGLKAASIAWPYTRIVAESVSGEGLWLVVRGPVTTNRAEHRAAHEAIIHLLPEEIRRHTAIKQYNLDRLRYMCGDPDVFYNPNAGSVDVGVTVPLETDSSPLPPSDQAPGSQRPEGWPVKAATAREKARKLLQPIQLPEGSHDIWIENGWSLVDGDRRYGADFDGRGLFVEWTAAAAYAGSTKPQRADAQYTELASADQLADSSKSRRTLASLGKEGGKPPSRSRRRQEEQEAANEAFNAWIDKWVKGEELTFWHDRFRRKEGCLWETESDRFISKDLQRFLGDAQGDPSMHLVATAPRKAAIESLKDAVSPPVVSEQLLSPLDYLKNYNLKTGHLLNTIAFQTGVVTLDPEAPHGFRLCIPEHWDYHNTYRPYSLPEEPPPEPAEFNDFLAFRWPDPKTRLAIMQLIGGSVLQRLPAENLFVVLKGPGGAGKGTLTRILCGLIGARGVFTVPNVARLSSSPFATSQLETAALLLVSDPPDSSQRKNRDALSDGMTIIRNLTGQDGVAIERKGRDQYTATVNANVWINTNFSVGDWITGDEDRDSWQRRLVAIPCGVQLPQAQQKADYERRFVSEYPSIAWHCIAAYAEMHHSDRGYSVSQEMLALKAEQIGGDMEKIQEFTGELRLEQGTWTSRKSIREAYCQWGKLDSLSKKARTDLYEAVLALPHVESARRADGEGFLGVACPRSDQLSA